MLDLWDWYYVITACQIESGIFAARDKGVKTPVIEGVWTDNAN